MSNDSFSFKACTTSTTNSYVAIQLLVVSGGLSTKSTYYPTRGNPPYLPHSCTQLYELWVRLWAEIRVGVVRTYTRKQQGG